jgi:hypothetical protein
MRQFIHLTNRVINKMYIIQIVKKPLKYFIHMNDKDINGFILFSSGSVNSDNNIIEICQKENKEDYNTISDFINK